jgi:hypothetical protein
LAYGVTGQNGGATLQPGTGRSVDDARSSDCEIVFMTAVKGVGSAAGMGAS